MICIKCNKEKGRNDMYYNNNRQRMENVCLSCKRETMYRYNLEKAKNQTERTLIHLRNVIRNMVEACEDKDSKKLRLWADVGRLEIGRQINAERWNKHVATNQTGTEA